MDIRSVRKVVFLDRIIEEGGFAVEVSNQGRKRMNLPFAGKINVDPKLSTTEHGIQCPHHAHLDEFREALLRLKDGAPGFVVEKKDVQKDRKKMVLTIQHYDALVVFDCNGSVRAEHGFCSICSNPHKKDKKFKLYEYFRRRFWNRFFVKSFEEMGYSESELELFHDVDDCWPYRIHSNDWIGSIVLPEMSNEECKLNIPAHIDIVSAVIEWLDSNPDQMEVTDGFVDDVIAAYHSTVMDATSMQFHHAGEQPEPYDLHLDKGVGAEEMCKKAIEMVDARFPLNEYATKTISIPMNHVPYYRRKGESKTPYDVPVRVLMACFAIATAVEECNRGDARWVDLKSSYKLFYANVWMPLGLYFLMRKGATREEATKAIKQGGR